MLEKYLNQDIDNPIYLFHGSPYKLSVITPKQSHDDRGNGINNDNAIFMFPSFLKATPYALKKAFNESIEGANEENSYFETSKRSNNYPYGIICNRIINEEEIGYVYVFLKDDTMKKDYGDYQYRCYHNLIPIDVVEIKFKDYKKYFEIIYPGLENNSQNHHRLG